MIKQSITAQVLPPLARVMTHCHGLEKKKKPSLDPLPLSKNLILQNCVQTRDVINYTILVKGDMKVLKGQFSQK